jgi:hypothetical protein
MTQESTENPQKTPKNFWQTIKTLLKNIPLDKAQAFLTLITAILSIYVTYQAHQIKKEIDLAQTNINKATFVKGLLETLTLSQDQKIKNDVSLIIVNRMIPQNNQEKLMVAEIAEQIYRENLRKAQTFAENFDRNTQNKGKTCDLHQVSGFSPSAAAFNIMEENNPEKAKKLLREFATQKTFKKGDSRIDPQKNCVEQLNRYYNVLNYVVYFQFNNEKYQDEINQFAQKLIQIGWEVPENEDNKGFGLYKLTGYTWKDDKKPLNTIRYYHVSDLRNAKRLEKLAEEHFKKDFSLDNLSVSHPNEPFGQIEVLIHDNGGSWLLDMVR